MLGTSPTQSGAVKPSSLEQQKYEPDLWADRITEIPSNMKKRADPNFTNPTYVGFAPKGLGEDDDGWLLWKCTGDTAIDIAYGSWTLRTTYTYD